LRSTISLAVSALCFNRPDRCIAARLEERLFSLTGVDGVGRAGARGRIDHNWLSTHTDGPSGIQLKTDSNHPSANIGHNNSCQYGPPTTNVWVLPVAQPVRGTGAEKPSRSGRSESLIPPFNNTTTSQKISRTIAMAFLGHEFTPTPPTATQPEASTACGIRTTDVSTPPHGGVCGPCINKIHCHTPLSTNRRLTAAVPCHQECPFAG
jgi:hypothetical protein